MEIVKETGTTAAIVITRQIVGTDLAEEVAEGLGGYDLPVFDHRTSQRVAYAEAMFEGKTVLDISGARKAQKEIQGIATELARLSDGGTGSEGDPPKIRCPETTRLYPWHHEDQ